MTARVAIYARVSTTNHGQDVSMQMREPRQSPVLRTITLPLAQIDWPDPSPLGDELPPVHDFVAELLPSSLRPMVEDVSERMQTPIDYAATAAIVALAGCVNRRAMIRPKVKVYSLQEEPRSILGSLRLTTLTSI